MAGKRPPKPGFHEASVPYTPDKLSLEQKLQLNREVLVAHDYTCAVTGAHFNAETALSANIVVVAIHPVETGGKLTVKNMLPMTPPAAEAFRDGDFTIGVDLELIVDLTRIAPDLLRQLQRSGLRQPPDRTLRADADNLHYHRTMIFQAVGG